MCQKFRKYSVDVFDDCCYKRGTHQALNAYNWCVFTWREQSSCLGHHHHHLYAFAYAVDPCTVTEICTHRIMYAVATQNASTLSHTHTHTHTSVHQPSQWQVGLPICLCQPDKLCVCVCGTDECVWAALCGDCWAKLITEWSILEPSEVQWDSPPPHGVQGSWAASGHGRGSKKLLCIVLQALISVSPERKQFKHKYLHSGILTGWMIQQD